MFLVQFGVTMKALSFLLFLAIALAMMVLCVKETHAYVSEDVIDDIAALHQAELENNEVQDTSTAGKEAARLRREFIEAGLTEEDADTVIAQAYGSNF
jgi:hypothetical protein